jgi:hypothetical protein
MTMTKQAQRLRKIIVPLDFSSSSESTIDYASMIAEKFAATLILVHVKKAVPQFQPFQTFHASLSSVPCPLLNTKYNSWACALSAVLRLRA